MTAAMQHVLDFFACWTTADAMIEATRERFTPATVWENVGVSRTVGIDEALDFTRQFFGQLDVARGEVVLHHIAQTSDDAVLTERTDIFYNGQGSVVASIRLMGVLEMDGPRIVSWRDYFDTRALGGG